MTLRPSAWASGCGAHGSLSLVPWDVGHEDEVGDYRITATAPDGTKQNENKNSLWQLDPKLARRPIPAWPLQAMDLPCPQK